MGLFNKLKNVLFEETEIDEEIEEPKEEKREKVTKKERRIMPIDESTTMELPKISKKEDIDLNELIDNDYDFEKEVDHDLFKMDKTFDFPAFDEEEFEEVTPKKKEEVKKEEPKEELEIVERRTKVRKEIIPPVENEYKPSPRVAAVLEVEETRKVFRPSPVISPVYGILDKNYRKEDVITRDEKLECENIKLDVDSVRKKAFGALEEDLAKEEPKIKYYDEVEEETEEYVPSEDIESSLLDEVVDSEIDVTKEMELPEEKAPIEDQIEEEIEEEFDNTDSLDEIDKLFEETREIMELPKEKSRTNKNKDKEEKKETIEEIVEEVKEEDSEEVEDEDSPDENDLFELIDSMYENKEDE